jgi:hypothetical protein
MWPNHWYGHSSGSTKDSSLGEKGASVAEAEAAAGDGTEAKREAEVSSRGCGNGRTAELQERPTPRTLLTRDAFISKFVGDLLVLITFGLCCPLLGLAVSLSMTLNLLTQRGLIGRFLLARDHSATTTATSQATSATSVQPHNPTALLSDPSSCPFPHPRASAIPDLALLALNESLLDLDISYYRLLWIVLWSSCFFIAFVCWDIAGDKLGALESIWLPSLAVLFVLSLQLFERYAHLFAVERSAVADPSDRDRETGISLESLPVPLTPSVTTKTVSVSPFHLERELPQDQDRSRSRSRSSSTSRSRSSSWVLKRMENLGI